MPNYCNYSMCVKGTKENIEEFIKVIDAGYDYSEMKFDYDRHLFRVFSSYYDEIEDLGDNVYQVIINGDCAWSVSCCMFDGYLSYYNNIKERYPNEFRGTTLPIESEKLNLDIEVFSEECGEGFQEHYVISNGIINVDDSVDYQTYYMDNYETKEEAEEDVGRSITDEEWEDGNGCIEVGGFDWDFTI